jgi:TolB-like protein/DNA-binding winged helix-turn-helix (wHTH) protein/tetratricopeptide (TPR) repeat protein
LALTYRTLRFGVFELNLDTQELRKDGIPIKLSPQPFSVLAMLAGRSGQIVTREELHQKIWGDETYVDFEHGLNQCIKQIRTALNDNSNRPLYIETLPRRGYRFLAPVRSKRILAPLAVTESSSSGTVARALLLERLNIATPSSATGAAVAPQSEAPAESPEPSASLNTVDDPELQASPAEAPPTLATLPTYGASVKSAWKSRRMLLPAAIILAMVAVGAGIAWRYQVRSRQAVLNTSVAVLPFRDLSPGKDQEFFSDGLTEELINDLSKVPGLKVTGRSSAFQFKGQNEDVRVIGRKLNVANVLEGSVRRDGNRVRITAELTNAADGFQLWSEEYEPTVDDIIAVQDEIARNVTTVLQTKLLGVAGAAPPSSRRTNPKAYQAYLQAQYLNRRGFDQPTFQKTLDYVNQAIQFDPDYAAAFALRSTLMLQGANAGFVEADKAREQARADAQKAIQLDPNLADGYLALAFYQMDYEWHWSAAEGSLQQAAKLEPGSAEINDQRAFLLRTMGKLEEAIKLQQQEVALDPLRIDAYLNLAFCLYAAGHYDEALAAVKTAVDLDPQAPVHSRRSEILLAQGHLAEALAETEQIQPEWQRLTNEAIVNYAMDRRKESDDALHQLLTKHQERGAFQIALVYAYRGELDQAFQWLDRAYAQRDAGMVVLKVHPLLKNIRQDPRYAELLRKMNLPS